MKQFLKCLFGKHEMVKGKPFMAGYMHGWIVILQTDKCKHCQHENTYRVDLLD